MGILRQILDKQYKERQIKEILSNIRQTYGNIETNKTILDKQYKERQIKEILSNIRRINYKTDKNTVSNILQTLHNESLQAFSQKSMRISPT